MMAVMKFFHKNETRPPQVLEEEKDKSPTGSPVVLAESEPMPLGQEPIGMPVESQGAGEPKPPFSDQNGFQQNKMIRTAQRLFWLVLFLTFLLLILKFRFLPPQVPIFYSLPWGEEQLGNPTYLFILPLLAFLLGLVNFFLAKIILTKEPLAAKILIWSSAFLALFMAITVFEIVFLIS
jgi:hypothetical protein